MLGVGSFGGIVDIDVCVSVRFEGFLFFGGKTRSLGTIQDKDSGTFIDGGVIGEHFGDIVLDASVVADAAGRENV